MAQVRIEVDAGITVEVIEGGNSSAEVAALQAQVADLTAKLGTARSYLQSASTADAADDAARAAALAAIG